MKIIITEKNIKKSEETFTKTQVSITPGVYICKGFTSVYFVSNRKGDIVIFDKNYDTIEPLGSTACTDSKFTKVNASIEVIFHIQDA